MTATNHALTGAIVATVVSVPWLAIPLAFASHFVLDSLPHYGEKKLNGNKFLYRVWVVDGSALLVLFVLLLLNQQWMAMLGAFTAISPDFAWVYRYGIVEKFGKIPPGPRNKFNEFHAKIQRFEFHGGLPIEFTWSVLATIFLISLI
jgi:hypothetical protein